MSSLQDKLKNPFDPKFLKWRVGATNKDKSKGIALAYLDAREVMKRLDDVCGLDGWRCRHIEVKEGFICEIDIKIGGEWITRSNAAGNTQVEAVKGGASDAFKRAAAVWGVGRYLYYLPNKWVAIKPAGKSYALAEIPSLPKWALPGEFNDDEADDAASAEGSMGADGELDFINDEGSIDSEKVLEAIKGAKTRPEFQAILARLTPSEQLAFKPAISNRTKEILNANN